MKLGNRRCQCSECREYFNSTGAFDKHRTGAYAKPGQWQGNRRCRSIEEMTGLGMLKNPAGFWIGSSRDHATLNQARPVSTRPYPSESEGSA